MLLFCILGDFRGSPTAWPLVHTPTLLRRLQHCPVRWGGNTGLEGSVVLRQSQGSVRGGGNTELTLPDNASRWLSAELRDCSRGQSLLFSPSASHPYTTQGPRQLSREPASLSGGFSVGSSACSKPPPVCSASRVAPASGERASGSAAGLRVRRGSAAPSCWILVRRLRFSVFLSATPPLPCLPKQVNTHINFKFFFSVQ